MRYEKGFSRFVTICHAIIIDLFRSYGIVNRRYTMYNRRKERGGCMCSFLISWIF